MKSIRQARPATTVRLRYFHPKLAMLVLLATGHATAGTLAQKPLFLGSTAPPNVILAVDDAPSLQNEVLMASGEDGYPAGAKTFRFLFADGLVADNAGTTSNLPPTVEYADARSPATNLSYFDPGTNYGPWPAYGMATLGDAPPVRAPWDPIFPNGAASAGAAAASCIGSGSKPPDFPKFFDLTQAIQCSGKGYTFSMSAGMIIPRGTVFLPASPPPESCAERNAAHWYTAKQDCSCNTTDLRCDEVAIAYFPAAFYLPANTPNPYASYQNILRKEATDGKAWDYYEIRPNNFTDEDEYQRAIQNFANWFTYSRKRHAAIRGAIGHAFEDIQYMRLGVFKASDSVLSPVPTVSLTDLDDPAAGKAIFVNESYDPVAPPGSTNIPGIYQYLFAKGAPILQAVKNLGSQFEKPGTIKYPCQTNTGILFTDGITDASDYTEFSAGFGNVDGGSGQPYADSVSDTLADIAMHYYSGNLYTDFPTGQVPVPAACNGANPDPRLDCRKNLHMNFYAVGLGLRGDLYDPARPFDPYHPPAGRTPIPWPSNEALQSSTLSGTDDLWHAAINGRGTLLSAKKPSEIRETLLNILNTVQAKSGTGSSAAADSPYLSGSSLQFQSSFDSSDWSGELSAYAFVNGALNTSQPVWEASDNVPSHTGRKVFSYAPKGTYCGKDFAGQGIAFAWENLNCSQQAMLDTISGTRDGLGQHRLDFIKGDTSKEERHGGQFRDRVKAAGKSAEIRLGDFVNSAPAYAGAEDYGYSILPGSEGGNTYQNFLETKAKRTPMVYIGGNDGMLHAFNAADGREVFAYVPNGVYGHLSVLTSPEYSTDTHRYFVDGSPKVADAYIGGSWKTVVAGTTGAGGRSIFALDVTDPANFGASHVLWEISDSAGNLPNLGYTVPQPAIVRSHSTDHPWVAIAANGYNSPSGKAVLFIIDLATGEILKQIDTQAGGNALNGSGGLIAKNGLGNPVVADVDQDGIADLAYAGDLEGNLWKFDLTSGSTSGWSIAHGTTEHPAPLFVACATHVDACASKDRQPITAKPLVARASLLQGGLMVFIGTGKYFEDGDNRAGTNPQVQSVYGLWDKNTLTSADAIGGSDLAEQTIDSETAASGRPIRLTSANPVDYREKSGWFMDLKLKGGTALGERVAGNPAYHDGRITFTTLVPPPEADDNQCTAGGSGWLMELYAGTGAYLDRQVNPIFDLNRDTQLDNNDLVAVNGGSIAPTGLGLNGIPHSAHIIRDSDYIYRITNLSDGSAGMEKGPQGEYRNSRLSWRQIR